ncbi:MAG: efflux RND transporter periplasmic adaptor subunit [Candidatus Hydrogenedentes bacterium]|nr:efflux RND transporter periplasmic adaptor subunit [Candidatus Hydrogenedentota bacterium]
MGNMSKNLIVAVALGLVVFGASSCSRSTDEAATGIKKETALTARQVETAKAEMRAFGKAFQAPGSLMPKEQAKVRALIDGPLDSVFVDIGVEVKRGDPLFTTRPVDARLAMLNAQAALATAVAGVADLKAWRRNEEVETLQAQLTRAQSEFKRIDEDKNRVKTLFDRGSVSPAEWDMARSAAEAAAAQVTAASEQLRMAKSGPTKEQVAVADAKVEQARAALAQAQQALTDTTVVAPFDGTVTMRAYKPGDFARRGETVIDMANLAVMEAEINVPERFATLVSMGQTVEVDIDVLGLKRQGTVSAVNQAVDARARTFLVKVTVDNADRAIKSGMFCTARFESPGGAESVAVPQSAVLQDEGRSFVWVNDSGKARRAFIKTGEQAGGFVEILEGAAGGEEVVVKNWGGLSDGLELAPTASAGPAAAP